MKMTVILNLSQKKEGIKYLETINEYRNSYVL